jgi:hypothetical protein
MGTNPPEHALPFPPSAAEGLRASSPSAAVISYAFPGRIRWEESAYPAQEV